MDRQETSDRTELEVTPDRTQHLNFLAYVPPTMRYTFKQGLDNALRAHRRQTGNTLRCFSPMTCPNDIDDPYDDIWETPALDDFPDAIISAGFGDLFRKEFVERFVNKGYFENAWEGPVDRRFAEAGMVDPDGWYTMFSLTPYVLVIDRKKLGNLPMPKRWSDLLEPCYRGNVILPGAEDVIHAAALVYFHKEFGAEGLKRLALNMKAPGSAIEVARTAGTAKSGGAICMMAWLFARSCSHPESTAILWPEDGALANPIYMLVKKDKREALAPALRYALGPEAGRLYVQSCYPVINPLVDNLLPDGAAFKWIGWDYIKSNDLEKVKAHAMELLLTTWKENR